MKLILIDPYSYMFNSHSVIFTDNIVYDSLKHILTVKNVIDFQVENHFKNKLFNKVIYI